MQQVEKISLAAAAASLVYFSSKHHGHISHYVAHIALGAVVFNFLMTLRRAGFRGFFGKMLRNIISTVPGASSAIEKTMEPEVDKSVKELTQKDPSVKAITQGKIPENGIDKSEIMSYLKALQKEDVRPDKGTAFAYSYYIGDNGDHVEFMKEVYSLYIQTNGLNPMAYPSLRILENQVVSMCAKLFNAPSTAVGSLTSGGTESNMLAVKTYRDLARATRNITDPELVAPITVHPSIPKACHLFGIKIVLVEVDAVTKRAIPENMKRAITSNTVMLVCSAPQFPHGSIDPVAAVAQIAIQYKIPLHVDSCIGGFVLPWIEKLGHQVTLWDFRIPGVTSISADLHKYGYSPKGASVIVYRDDNYRKYQFFAQSNWPGGLFVSPSLLGTRAGGGIAAAWASLSALGESGFMEKVKKVLEIKQWFIEQLKKIPNVEILGIPESSLLAFTTTHCNVLAVADEMGRNSSWKIECNTDSIHMTILPTHWDIKENFIQDFKKAIDVVLANPALQKQGLAATYGLVSLVPDPNMVEDFLTLFFRKIYSEKF